MTCNINQDINIEKNTELMSMSTINIRDKYGTDVNIYV